MDDDGVCAAPSARGTRSGGQVPGKRRRLSKAPASQSYVEPQVSRSRVVRAVVLSGDLVSRLRAGRTLSRLQTLMQWHLF